MKTDPVIDAPKSALCIHQDMAALAVSVVHQQIKKGNRLKVAAVPGGEVEIMVIGGMLYKQLD
jgi:hypothetical protein